MPWTPQILISVIKKINHLQYPPQSQFVIEVFGTLRLRRVGKQVVQFQTTEHVYRPQLPTLMIPKISFWA